MPIYEYECIDCGKKFEVMQRFNDRPLETCSHCGGHLHKLISHSSFILKGNGWYVTDYARSERKKASEAPSKTIPGKDSKKAASKGESKPKAEVTVKH